jgi:hypothetical protein
MNNSTYLHVTQLRMANTLVLGTDHLVACLSGKKLTPSALISIRLPSVLSAKIAIRSVVTSHSLAALEFPRIVNRAAIQARVTRVSTAICTYADLYDRHFTVLFPVLHSHFR